MKNTLQLRTSQQLAFTPQLQQSLQFLQLSSLELEQTLNALIIENPFLTLEHDSDKYLHDPVDDGPLTYDSEILPIDTHLHEDEISNTYLEPSVSEAIETQNLAELPLDSQWEDHYQDDFDVTQRHDLDSLGVKKDELMDDYYENKTTSISLKEHLLEQVSVTPFTRTEELIAIFIIDAIDENGYLTQSREDIISALKVVMPAYDFESDYKSVLSRIQLFDPISLATYSLQERLLIQLNAQSNNEVVELAKILLKDKSELLEKRDFRTIIKSLRISEVQLQSALSLLATLDPFPAKDFYDSENLAITPDIVVLKTNNEWQIQLNNSLFPKIVLDTEYVKMLQREKKNSAKRDNVQKNAIEYLQQAYQSAKTVLLSLEGRYKTLLLVANQIVANQIEFFEKGESFLKPMVLADIASILEMSESTISRACQNKYLICARGTFELKYFFSSHVTNEQGEEISSSVIKSYLKQWIESENTTKPFSDSKLETKLKELGYDVARRTVAKYREQLGFPASNLRKTL
ncbi:RNA polymerase factor sigma-54 [Thorsellia anophelis]|uniref:RNA polymerase sigma-54 factor n=1 Tax=Thorsellia anophelis DSM 18579 TaxID=1123402 RepID=A0A1I0A9G8_9GAMM|nr:RNA polymerase factor sigma-54 [Thorsellia anophelis]SES90860.1 RNA polymerase, sigma 54 subunit, RpoN/SigL [Thorsellia anophelis DSM 18579]